MCPNWLPMKYPPHYLNRSSIVCRGVIKNRLEVHIRGNSGQKWVIIVFKEWSIIINDMIVICCNYIKQNIFLFLLYNVFSCPIHCKDQHCLHHAWCYANRTCTCTRSWIVQLFWCLSLNKIDILSPPPLHIKNIVLPLLFHPVIIIVHSIYYSVLDIRLKLRPTNGYALQHNQTIWLLQFTSSPSHIMNQAHIEPQQTLPVGKWCNQQSHLP